MTLEELADRIEIDDLLTRYATGVDRRDWDLWESCFTADAHIDYSAFGGTKGGVKDVRRWLEDVMVRFPMSQHLVMNREVAIDGDSATARSAFYNPMAVPTGRGDERQLFFCGGYYCDKLKRTRDGWRIAERVEEFSYSTMTQPTLQVKPAEAKS
jgi:3-phenylpropionate/cinnamic acid dioxygenase small subunit